MIEFTDTPSPRGLSRISARQVALALASRFSRMLSFQIKDMEFTGPYLPEAKMALLASSASNKLTFKRTGESFEEREIQSKVCF